MTLFYRAVQLALKGIFKILYRHRTYGEKHIIEGGAIIAPNHTSFLDPPIVSISLRDELHFLAKGYLFTHSFLGWIIRRLNAHPVNRNGSDTSPLKLACRLLKEDKKVIVFPEGHRSQTSEIQPFKGGIGLLAARSQKAVIPTYISGALDVWNRKQRFPRFFGRTTCIFGSPITIEQFQHLESKSAQRALTEAVQESVKALEAWHRSGATGTPP